MPKHNPTDEWFVLLRSEENHLGPFSTVQLQEAARRGELKPDDLVGADIFSGEPANSYLFLKDHFRGDCQGKDGHV